MLGKMWNTAAIEKCGDIAVKSEASRRISRLTFNGKEFGLPASYNCEDIEHIHGGCSEDSGKSFESMREGFIEPAGAPSNALPNCNETGIRQVLFQLQNLSGKASSMCFVGSIPAFGARRRRIFACDTAQRTPWRLKRRTEFTTLNWWSVRRKPA